MLILIIFDKLINFIIIRFLANFAFIYEYFYLEYFLYIILIFYLFFIGIMFYYLYNIASSPKKRLL